jgi:hypothetical protein
MGNAQFNQSYELADLPVNRTYYWSVQAVDSCFAGSSFAPEASLMLYAAVVPPSGPAPGDANHDGVVSQAEFDAVAQNYWGPTSRPFLTNLVTDGTGLFQTALTNAAAWNFGVEVSTNLVDWDPLGPAMPLLEFYDPQATNYPSRFYRLSWP